MTHDLAEHVGTLVALLGVGWAAAATIFWRSIRETLARIEKKVDGQQTVQTKCREELPEKFTLKKDFDAEIEIIWEAINHHGHNGGGKVIR